MCGSERATQALSHRPTTTRCPIHRRSLPSGYEDIPARNARYQSPLVAVGRQSLRSSRSRASTLIGLIYSRSRQTYGGQQPSFTHSTTSCYALPSTRRDWSTVKRIMPVPLELSSIRAVTPHLQTARSILSGTNEVTLKRAGLRAMYCPLQGGRDRLSLTLPWTSTYLSSARRVSRPRPRRRFQFDHL